MLTDRICAGREWFFIVIENMRKELMLAWVLLVMSFVRTSWADAGPSEEPGCRCGLGAASSLGTAGCLVSGGLALLYVERRRKR